MSAWFCPWQCSMRDYIYPESPVRGRLRRDCRAASLPPGKISYKAVVSLPENNCEWEGSGHASLMEEIEKFYNTIDAPSTPLLPFSFFGHTAGMAIWTRPLTCALLLPRADITNQFLYSFLGSPDRTSECLSGLHSGHSLPMRCIWYSKWNLFPVLRSGQMP